MAKILIIDDDPDFVEATRIVLEQAGHETKSAASGDEGVDQVGAYKPDLIVLDVMMTTKSEGFAVSHELRKNPKTREIPIIMITSRVGDKHRARAIELGVNDYLGKPYQDSQLLDAIRRSAPAIGDDTASRFPPNGRRLNPTPVANSDLTVPMAEPQLDMPRTSLPGRANTSPSPP